jgi:hypothetical protein
MNFNAEEATVLWENGILVSPAWHLSHGWHVSVAGYAVRLFRRVTRLTT